MALAADELKPSVSSAKCHYATQRNVLFIIYENVYQSLHRSARVVVGDGGGSGARVCLAGA